MGEHDALIGEGAEILGAVIAAFLGGGQQRMQHLDRRLEHFDEFQQPLRRAVQAAAVGIGVGVGLAVVFQLADVDLADQRRDILVVLVAGLGLSDADLAQPRGHQLDDAEFGDVAADLVQPLGGPGGDEASKAALGDAVFVLQQVAHAIAAEKAERRFEDRADLAVDGQRVDRLLFHQLLQALGQRRFAAAHRPEQVKDLLSFFQALGGIAEIADDSLDRILHAVEIRKGGVNLDRPVGEDSAQPLVGAGIDELGLADGRDHALRRGRIHALVVAARQQILLQA